MAIILDYPIGSASLHAHLGPGFLLRAHHDTQLQLTDTWTYFIRDTSLNQVYLAELIPLSDNFGSLFTIIGTEHGGNPPVTGGVSINVQSGQEVQILLELFNVNNQLLESTILSFYDWDPTSMLYRLTYDAVTRLPSGGGFDATAQQQLEDLWSNLVRDTLSINTTHTPVSGTGFISIMPATVAILYTVVAFPSSPRVDPGSPDYFFSLGFFTPLNGANAFKSTRISFANGIIHLPQGTTQFGYTLTAGVQVQFFEYLLT